MIQRYVINGALGPNECIVSHDYNRGQILVESQKQLLTEDMREIEQTYLNLKTFNGWRGSIHETQTPDGKWITIWFYLEFTDCDWS